MDTIDNETKLIPISEDEFAREPLDGRRVDHRRPAPPSARSKRWPSFVAIGSLIALVALSLALFNIFGAQLRNHPGSGGCSPTNYRVHMPQYGSLLDVAPLGNDDGWAVGWTRDSQTVMTTLIMRLHNCVWQPVGSNVAPTIENAQLDFISMGSADDGWAFGYEYNPDLSVGPYIALHYHNGIWSRVSLPVNPHAGIYDSAMTSPNNGWALFDYHTPIAPNEKPGDNQVVTHTLLHYNGRAWTPIAFPFAHLDAPLFTMAALPSGDLWIAGFENERANDVGLIAHYHKGQWSVTRSTEISGIGAGMPLVQFNGVSFVSPTEGYVSGYACSTGDANCHGLILRYDGAHWNSVALPAVSSQYVWHLSGVTAVAPGSAWAFGDEELNAPPSYNPAGGEILLTSHNGVWQSVSLPKASRGVFYLRMYSPSQGWALAYPDKIDGMHSGAYPIYYNNGVWVMPPIRYV